MAAFPELVSQFAIPLARKNRWRSFCEIGSRRGDAANVLLGLDGASLTIIDPCLDTDLVQRYSTDSRVTVHRSISLDALPLLKEPFDCILIDGDHNWYTVYNELRLIRERDLLRVGGMIFFHDVSWPYGRRDMYYRPDLIPASHRHPYEPKTVAIDESEVANRDRSQETVYHATHEGGHRNGVLTAIEDFMKECDGDYFFWRVRRKNGMGILQCRRRTLRDGLSFIALVGKAVRYDSQAIFGRLSKSLLTQKTVVGSKRTSTS